METHDRPGFPWWLALLLMLALAAGVGLFTYNLGMAQGIAQSGAVAAAPAAPGTAVAPVYIYPRYWGWGWRGWGFGFFPFFGIFWFFIVFGLLRRLWWGPRWYRRGYYGYGCGPYGYYDRDLNDWHRRAHGEQPPPTTTQL